MNLTRSAFLKCAGGGIATLVVGSKLGWVFGSPVYVAAAVQTISLEIGDAIKNMVTHNSINAAQCYFWVYKSVNPDFPAEVPGPIIFASRGDTINLTVTNRLDEPHAFFIPGMVDSGEIAPGATWNGSFVANTSGAHLYFDNLNPPVNRVMGLHGAFIVMPTTPAPGHKLTPYDDPTPGVQQLFDDFGSSAHFPGLAWEQGDSQAASFAPPFRTYVWLDHQAAPNLFQQIGSLAAGVEMPAQEFLDKFLRGAFDATNSANFMGAQYFTINGQSGHFSHNTPFICPNLRVGEPCVVHILNAGLWAHSMHLHANHFYVTFKNSIQEIPLFPNGVQENPIWLDVFEVNPMDRIDYVIPYMRPPDVPNARGIGMPDTPRTSLVNANIPGSTAHPIWPPTEELRFAIPVFSIPAQTPPGVIAPNGVPASTALNQGGQPVDLGVQLSPLCYPMHDHSEPSQTSQGGNYNLGLIAGMNFTGDRNLSPGTVLPDNAGFTNVNGVVTFPHAPAQVEFPQTTPPAHPAAPPM